MFMQFFSFFLSALTTSVFRFKFYLRRIYRIIYLFLESTCIKYNVNKRWHCLKRLPANTNSIWLTNYNRCLHRRQYMRYVYTCKLWVFMNSLWRLRSMASGNSIAILQQAYWERRSLCILIMARGYIWISWEGICFKLMYFRKTLTLAVIFLGIPLRTRQYIWWNLSGQEHTIADVMYDIAVEIAVWECLL